MSKFKQTYNTQRPQFRTKNRHMSNYKTTLINNQQRKIVMIQGNHLINLNKDKPLAKAKYLRMARNGKKRIIKVTL